MTDCHTALRIGRLKKDELVRYIKGHCRHRHSYIDHPNCFLTENNIAERVGFFDIETTGLFGNWDYIISFALKIGDKVYGRSLTPVEVIDYATLDKNLIEEFSELIRKLDRIVVYWGKDRRHDLPFIRTRALKWNIYFPEYRDVFVTD